MLSGDTDLSDNEVFIQWNGLSPDMEDRALGWPQINRMLNNSWRSVVVDRWKLNLCAADQCELFDLRSDPHETRNLFDDPAQRDRSSRHGLSHQGLAGPNGRHCSPAQRMTRLPDIPLLMRAALGLILALCLLSVACDKPPEPFPTATPAAVVAAIPTATPEPTSTPTPSPTDTPTPEPTALADRHAHT